MILDVKYGYVMLCDLFELNYNGLDVFLLEPDYGLN